MTTDSETRTIKKYLFDNPEHLETAQSVSDSWLKVKEVLCRGFLEHLRTELAGRARKEWPDIASDSAWNAVMARKAMVQLSVAPSRQLETVGESK